MLFSCNNCYYHFVGGTRGHYEANPSTYPRGQDGPILHARSGFPALILCKKIIARSGLFWTMSAMKLKKAAED